MQLSDAESLCAVSILNGAVGQQISSLLGPAQQQRPTLNNVSGTIPRSKQMFLVKESIPPLISLFCDHGEILPKDKLLIENFNFPA